MQTTKNRQPVWHKTLIVALLLIFSQTASASVSNLVITGVFDGSLSGGIPKGVELYVVLDIADLSTYGLGSASNGGGSDGEEFTFPAVAVPAGSCIYVTSETSGFNTFFGFDPDYTTGAMAINGDDAVELFYLGGVADVFGERDTLGDGEPWDYTDGWGYRNSATGPDGSTFVLGNWSFSGINGLEGGSSNATATTPFPIGTYSPCLVIDDPPTVDSTSPADNATNVPADTIVSISFSEDVIAPAGAFDLSCTSSGTVSFTLGGGPQTFTLTPDAPFADGEECSVGVTATMVEDQDGDSDNLAEDFFFGFSIAEEVLVIPDVVINETDSDTPGGDTLEFIELYDGGAGATDLSGLAVVLFNGGGSPSGLSYNAFDLDGLTTDAEGFFVIGDSGVANVDLVVSNGFLQNGADAVTLFIANATDFPNGSAITTINLIDAIVYDTNDNDDPDVLPLLNVGQPQVNEGGAGDKDNHSNQRCPNGAGGGRNTDTYIQEIPTPGAVNDCPTPIINETDADTPGGDTLEFIELFDGGGGNLPLDGFVVVLFNGGGNPTDLSYNAFDLDGFSTDADGYFVIGNSGVANVDLVASNGFLQNGADAVTVFIGDADDFPNGTAVTTVNLIDAIVYDTNDGDDAALLPLLNAGQPQVNEGGNGDKDNHSNQRCPNGFGGDRNTDAYDQAAPTPGVANVCPPIEIFDIQGSGDASPFAGFSVRTNDNIVTALASDGFFMQTPDVRSDGDINTSDGIFVFTGGAPSVQAGDHVDVDGMVVEFFGFTEYTLPSVSVSAEGNGPSGIVTPVEFNASVPSPNPLAPSCAIEYECYEGMLIHIDSGVVSGGNQRFGNDPLAETYIVASPNRGFTETGTLFPGLGAPIDTWDGNPEVFEMDDNKLGLPNQALAAGSTFEGTGVLGFEFGGYEFWPSSLTVTPANPVIAVRPAVTGEMTVGALNMFVLDVGAGDLPNRAAKLSNYIRNVMRSPDIIAVSEVFSMTELSAVADRITADDPGVVYTPFLIDHNNIGFGIDLGFLIGADVDVDSIVQQGLGELHTFDNTPLHDRPPLLFEGRYTGNGLDFPFAVVAVHNRSLGSITDPDEGERVRNKRLEQAQSIAAKAQTFQTSNPDTPYIIIGDFNAFQFTDGLVDVIGQISGIIDPAKNLVSGPDLVDPNLTNQVAGMSLDANKYSFVFRGNAGALDNALTSSATDTYDRGLQIARGNSDAAVDQLNDIGTANRSSDHDGLVFYMMTDADGDGFPDDEDICPFGAGDDGGSFNNSTLLDGCIVPIPTTDFRGLMILALLLLTLGSVAIRRTIH